MFRITLAILMCLILSAVLFSCGGSSSNPTSGIVDPSDPPSKEFTPGSGNNGGGTGTPPLADLMDSQRIQGASENAPLGTTPDYQVVEITPEDSDMSASRVASVLGDGETCMIYRVTVAAEGETPDFDADPSTLNFLEGTGVDLWVEYEAVPGIALTRTFMINEIDFTYTGTFTASSTGIHTMKFPLHLFYLEGNDETPATFSFSLGWKAASAVVLPDTFITKSVAFTILPVDTEVVNSPGGGWQVAWETQLVQTDYDYNDLVVRMSSEETKIVTEGDDYGKVCQIEVTVKALARGEGYSADWQFNLENAFPGAEDVYSYTQLYKGGTDTPDGPTRTWHSTMGVCIPVFTPIKNVLPSPPGHGSVVNVQKGEPFYNGGYAKVKILFPVPTLYVGDYRPAPYTQQMLILDDATAADLGYPADGEVWIISLTTNRGGNKIAGERYPLGFILPATAPAYSWPLEGVNINKGYPEFEKWVQWWNSESGAPSIEPTWWDDVLVPGDIVSGYNLYSMTSDRAGTSNILNGPALPIHD